MKFNTKNLRAWLLAVAAAAAVVAADSTLPETWRIPAQIIVAVVAVFITPHTKP
jgi:hypothetical protein